MDNSTFRDQFRDAKPQDQNRYVDAEHAEAAVRVGRKVGGWIRCSISTCVECHDEDCVNDQHEVLPLTAVGSDVLISCEKCGAALHRD